MEKKSKILIVDDAEDTVELLKRGSVPKDMIRQRHITVKKHSIRFLNMILILSSWMS